MTRIIRVQALEFAFNRLAIARQMTPTRFSTVGVSRSSASPSNQRSRFPLRVCRGVQGTKLARYFLIGFGGFLGALARYWVGSLISSRLGGRFPYGTFLINMTGCFLIGVAVTLLDQRTHWSSGWRYLVPIGFIGAYTTFSTFELETLSSVQEGALMTAALNVVLSVVIGFAAVWLGIASMRAVLGTAKAGSVPQASHALVHGQYELGGLVSEDVAVEIEG